jgi:hypothetical protein
VATLAQIKLIFNLPGIFINLFLLYQNLEKFARLQYLVPAAPLFIEPISTTPSAEQVAPSLGDLNDMTNKTTYFH